MPPHLKKTLEEYFEMPHGKLSSSIDKFAKTIAGLGGNPVTVFHRFRTDRLYCERLAEFAVNDGLAGWISLSDAERLLDQRIFYPLGWSQCGLQYELEEEHHLRARFPWTEAQLTAPCPFNKGKRVCDTHWAFPGPPTWYGHRLLLSDWQDLHGYKNYALPQNRKKWQDDVEFRFPGQIPRSAACDVRWYLVPLTIDPELNPRQIDDKKLGGFLGSSYELTTPAEAVAAIMAYHLSYDHPPFFDTGCFCRVTESMYTTFAYAGVGPKSERTVITILKECASYSSGFNHQRYLPSRLPGK